MAFDSPSVTIIGALYRPGSLLTAFLERLDRTIDASSEVILVDDHSDDGTLEALNGWRAGRQNVSVIENSRNRGVATSRNVAVARARGEFVWFVDHDDVWDPQITRRMLSVIEPTVDVVVCRAQYYFDAARLGAGRSAPIVDGLDAFSRVTGERAIWMLTAGLVHGFLWSKLIRRETLGNEPFPALTSQSDIAGLAGVLAAARAVVFIPDVLYSYVNVPGSITRVRHPNLDNLAVAYGAVLDAAASTPTVDSALVGYFTCWFYCRALVLTPVRQHSPRELRQEGLRRARGALGRVNLSSVRAQSPSLWLLMCGVRYTPWLVGSSLRVLYGILDTGRRLARR